MGEFQSHAVILLVILSDRICFSSSLSCSYFHECSGESIQRDQLLAYGYKSAFGRNTSFYGGAINCDGALSCYRMSSITSQTEAGIICRGTQSCSNTIMQIMDTSPGIHCHGTNSCSFANITIFKSSFVECNGYLSCSNMYIYGITLINAQAMLSLYQTTINTTGASTSIVNINLLGSLSGFGAKLICATGHICNINCLSYNACYMFYIICIGVCIINGPIPKSGSFPINITTSTSFNAALTAFIPKVFASEAVVPHDDLLCNILNFDENQEHEGGAAIVIEGDEEGPMCCRGKDSLRNVHDLVFKTEANNDLICSGYGACRSSTIIGNNGTIYCEAQSACHTSDITNMHSIYCAGGWSCFTSNITNANYVACTGYVSCREATFINNDRNLNLYFVAAIAGKDATIYCNGTGSCNVFCSGDKSCLGMRLFCLHNCKVECHEEEANCPIIFESTDNPQDTKDPTLNPTKGPTFNPTRGPTKAPTLMFQTEPVMNFSTSQTDNRNLLTTASVDVVAILLIVLCGSLCIAAIASGIYWIVSIKTKKEQSTYNQNEMKPSIGSNSVQENVAKLEISDLNRVMQSDVANMRENGRIERADESSTFSVNNEEDHEYNKTGLRHTQSDSSSKEQHEAEGHKRERSNTSSISAEGLYNNGNNEAAEETTTGNTPKDKTDANDIDCDNAKGNTTNGGIICKLPQRNKTKGQFL